MMVDVSITRFQPDDLDKLFGETSETDVSVNIDSGETVYHIAIPDEAGCYVVNVPNSEKKSLAYTSCGDVEYTKIQEDKDGLYVITDKRYACSIINA